MNIDRLLVALILCGLLVPLAGAETGRAGSAPWYTIELVIFTRSTPPGSSGEIWPEMVKELDWRSVRTANDIAAPTDSRQLTAAKLALRRSGGLIPVIHEAWRQPVFGRRSARPLYLRSEREIAPGTPMVEGMVKISVSRYLHAELDLLLRGSPAGAQRMPGGFQSYHFNEHRRMRSRELHYIDHPLLGMLIEITPIDLPPVEAGEPASADQPVGEKPAKPE